jgi:SAM-dependent methyltransferase
VGIRRQSRFDDPLLQHRTLETLASARNYNEWVSSLAEPYLGLSPLEIGSGLGEFAALWLAAGVPHIAVSELDQSGVEILEKRFAADDRVDVLSLDITQPDPTGRQFSSVVAINVLEHIEDDVGALSRASALVAPGGAVVVFVPAHPWAMSVFDRSIGHWRRYTKQTLGSVFADAGLSLERIHHINAPGLVAWTVGMKFLRRTPTDAAILRAYDRIVVPVTRRAETRWTPPFGQSLFAVGRASVGDDRS